MSRGNPYANAPNGDRYGDPNPSSTNPYASSAPVDDPYGTGAPNGGGRERERGRRPGGYGGFYGDDNSGSPSTRFMAPGSRPIPNPYGGGGDPGPVMVGGRDGRDGQGSRMGMRQLDGGYGNPSSGGREGQGSRMGMRPETPGSGPVRVGPGMGPGSLPPPGGREGQGSRMGMRRGERDDSGSRGGGPIRVGGDGYDSSPGRMRAGPPRGVINRTAGGAVTAGGGMQSPYAPGDTGSAYEGSPARSGNRFRDRVGPASATATATATATANYDYDSSPGTSRTRDRDRDRDASQTSLPSSQQQYEGGDWRRRLDRGGITDDSDGSRSRERNGYSGGRAGTYAAGAVNGTGGITRRGARGRNIDDVLRFIQEEWDLMTQDDCVPVQVALQLMDPSSLGKADRYNEFQNTHTQLQRALKIIVNEHHQGFNSSIGTFHKIQSSIQASQGRIRFLKASLGDAKGGLLTTKPELKGLATSSQSYDDTLQLLGQVENLQRVSEKLEARISEKRFLSSVDILQDALRLVRRSELEHISALSDMRAYFSNQETTLTDILIEELHDHLYLKSPYCQSRWKKQTSDGKRVSNSLESPGLNPWERPVYLFLSNLDTSRPLVEDPLRNPEADNFYYIQVILESLNKMGHLDLAVERIEHRLPVELFSVVDKTNIEVDHRHPDLRQHQVNGSKRKSKLPDDTTEGRGVVLSEFLWTLYSKFEAIAEGHRVVHEVVSGIVEREKIRDAKALTGGFRELWKLYQSEMRSLLHDYLAPDSKASFGSSTAVVDGGNVFQRRQRDRTKRMFKLSEMDQKSREMIAEQEALDEILKSSVPGLVSKSRNSKSGVSVDSSRAGQDSSGTGHKLLMPPSVFNMSLLLPPSLAFLQRLKDIVPMNSDIVMSTLTSFLDDFLINVFHPQLEEAVTEMCMQTLMELDTFQQDPDWDKYSPKPVFKGAVRFMGLIKAFSKMLNSIPHDQIFTQLIITQLLSYHERCHSWYEALVARAGSQNETGLKPAAALSTEGSLHEITESLWEAIDADRIRLLDKETALLIQYANENPIQPYDIICDPKNVMALSLLYNSLQWLTSSLRHLRHITPHQNDSSSHNPNQPPMNRRWTLISSFSPSPSSVPIHLPLTPTTARLFDNALDAYVSLSHLSLATLRLDIRLVSISLIDQSLQGPIILPSPATSASPSVLALTSELGSINQNLVANLGVKERHYVTSGYARLVDRKFVSGAVAIKSLNRYGASRVLIDVLVAGKGLRDIVVTSSSKATNSNPVTSGSMGLGLRGTTSSSSSLLLPSSLSERSESLNLPLATTYYSWFLEGAPRVVELAKEEKAKGDQGLKFSYDELKCLVELCFSEGLGSEEREEVVGAKRGLADALLGLGEGFWDA